MDRQLLRQKVCQNISVIQTNTCDDIWKTVDFDILIQVFLEDDKNTMFVLFTEIFWRTFWRNNWQSIFDIVKRLRLRVKRTVYIYRHQKTAQIHLNQIFCRAYDLTVMLSIASRIHLKEYWQCTFLNSVQKKLRCTNLCSENLKLHGFLMTLPSPY